MTFSSYWQALRRRWPSGRCLAVFNDCPSTHQLGRRLIRDLEADGTTPPLTDFVAWSQTAGVGRMGRTWESPPGSGIYATFVRQLEVPVPQVPLRIAVAAAETACGSLTIPGACRIKWPNDLMIGDAKIGGLLIDAFSQPGEPSLALVSIGLNVSGTPILPGETAKAGSLGLASSPELLAEIAVELVTSVDHHLTATVPFETGAVESVVDRYRALSWHEVGQKLVCRTVDTTLAGTFLGIDDTGLLRLQSETGERRLAAAEVLNG